MATVERTNSWFSIFGHLRRNTDRLVTPRPDRPRRGPHPHKRVKWAKDGPTNHAYLRALYEVTTITATSGPRPAPGLECRTSLAPNHLGCATSPERGSRHVDLFDPVWPFGAALRARR
jgi:hypothetical protein